MVSSEYPEMGFLGPSAERPPTSSVHLHVDDCDAVMARAVALGATVKRPASDQLDVPHEVHEGELGIIGVDDEAPLDIDPIKCPWSGKVWHPLALSGAYSPGYSTALPDSPEEPSCPAELAILVSAQFIDGTEDCYVRGKNAEAIAEERGCSFYPAWFHNPDW